MRQTINEYPYKIVKLNYIASIWLFSSFKKFAHSFFRIILARTFWFGVQQHFFFDSQVEKYVYTGIIIIYEEMLNRK